MFNRQVVKKFVLWLVVFFSLFVLLAPENLYSWSGPSGVERLLGGEIWISLCDAATKPPEPIVTDKGTFTLTRGIGFFDIACDW